MRFIKKLIKLIVILAVLAVIGEIVLREMEFEFKPVPIKAEKFFPKKSFHKVGYEFNQDLFESDPMLFWALRPQQRIGIKKVNDQGFLQLTDREQFMEAPMKILCIGDSCTGGIPKGYPDYLDDYLRDMVLDHDIVVMNAGVYGYSSYQGKKYLGQLFERYKPNIVVAYFLWNDMRPAINKSDEAMGGGNPLLLKIHNILSPTKVYQGVRKILDEGKNRIGISQGLRKTASFRVSPDEYRKNFEAMRKTTEERGAKFITVIPWHRLDTSDTSILDFEDLGKPGNLIALFEQYTAGIKTIGNPLDCKLIFKEYPPDVYFQDGGIFPSALAHNVIAEHLLNTLLAWGNISDDTYARWLKLRKPDSQKPHELRARIQVFPKELVVSPATTVTLTVSFKNIGDTIWLESADFGYVELGCRLLHEDGTIVQDTYRTFPLGNSIKPGERGTIKIDLDAPMTPGTYMLEFDMKDIGITWFSDTGSETAKIMLRVV